MSEPIFWRGIANATLADAVACTDAQVPPGTDLSMPVRWIAPLEDAEPGALVFFDHPKYQDALATTRATACFVTERYAAIVPSGESFRACARHALSGELAAGLFVWLDRH
jgi:UDP-3-O-[3-hydroxymyristoyl] glucosamine N-acyltransferase